MLNISVVTIAHNEEKNIEACLGSTKGWADEHIVVDDFSSDRTANIAKANGATVFHRRMDVEGAHRNWAYQKARNEWVLSLDADEELSEELKREISDEMSCGGNRKNSMRGQFNAYSIPLRTYIGDYWVQYGGWYPAGKLRLFKKSKFKYEEVAVHPKIILEGKCGHLKGDIVHKGYSGFSDLFDGLNRQTSLEAKKWFDEKRKIGIGKMIWKACDRFFRVYIRKKGYKDGIVGFVISIQSALYQILSYVKYWEMKQRYKQDN